MEIHTLRKFVAVYDERNLSAASARLRIAQPSLSAAIAGVEREVGTALFVRTRRGMIPTPAAVSLYRDAQDVLAAAARLDARIRGQTIDGGVTLGVAAGLDPDCVGGVARALMTAGAFDLRIVSAGEDCHARLAPKSLLRADEEFALLWTETYALAAAPDHPLAQKPNLRPRDLNDVRMIARAHCERALSFVRAGVTPRIVAIADSDAMALALASAGVGVAIVPLPSGFSGANIVVAPIEGVDVARPIGFAFPAGGELHPAFQTLLGGRFEPLSKIKRARGAASPEAVRP